MEGVQLGGCSLNHSQNGNDIRHAGHKKKSVSFYSESAVLAFLKLMVKSCWGCIWNRRQLPVTSFVPVCECFIVSVCNSVFAVSLFFVSNSFAENCYTMPVVNLNDFDFEGRFDSSIPTSLVSSSTAFRLKSLDAHYGSHFGWITLRYPVKSLSHPLFWSIPGEGL